MYDDLFTFLITLMLISQFFWNYFHLMELLDIKKMLIELLEGKEEKK